MPQGLRVSQHAEDRRQLPGDAVELQGRVNIEHAEELYERDEDASEQHQQRQLPHTLDAYRFLMPVDRVVWVSRPCILKARKGKTLATTNRIKPAMVSASVRSTLSRFSLYSTAPQRWHFRNAYRGVRAERNTANRIRGRQLAHFESCYCLNCHRCLLNYKRCAITNFQELV